MTQIPRARRSPVAPENCSLARAIDLIGDRWSLKILRSALYGVRRFDDFQSELGLPRTVLSGRLKRLVNGGLMQRQTYREPGKRARPEYILTRMGEALRPVLIGLTQWGDTWTGTSSPPISFTTRQGGAVHAGFINEKGQEVAQNDMRIVLRKPSGS